MINLVKTLKSNVRLWPDNRRGKSDDSVGGEKYPKYNTDPFQIRSYNKPNAPTQHIIFKFPFTQATTVEVG